LSSFINTFDLHSFVPNPINQPSTMITCSIQHGMVVAGVQLECADSVKFVRSHKCCC